MYESVLGTLKWHYLPRMRMFWFYDLTTRKQKCTFEVKVLKDFIWREAPEFFLRITKIIVKIR